MARRLLALLISLSLPPLIGVPVWAADSTASSERPAGSGVIVHPDGYVLTAYHVVAGAKRIAVVTSGEFRAPAVIVSADQEHDLALLKMDTVGLSEAVIGYAGAVRLDQEVIAVGFPFGLRDVSVTRGRIAAVRTKGVKRVFQVDAAINPGNSGGPVFNQRAEVIGLLTTKFSHPSGIVPEGMSFAVPISYATPLLANIPDFDFTTLGKMRKESKSNGKAAAVASELARTTVRIETVRATDGGPPGSAPVAPAASSKPQGPITPVPHTQTPPPSAHIPKSDGPVAPGALPDVKLAAVQLAELERLAQRGIEVPQGMALIPEGEFLMGAEDGLPDVRPIRRVHLSSYWIDTYEVTNGEYRRCVDAGVCTAPKVRVSFDTPEQSRHPVVNVTWMQARNYCQWIGHRLPTEAEWEKAARGVDGRRYPWGNGDGPLLSRLRNGDTRTVHREVEPVGSFQEGASPYGVFDMAGNVWEWVRDWYAEDFYATAPTRDPQGPLRGSFRVLRGGDWGAGPVELRASFRGWDEMTYWGPTLGFRCAGDVP